MTRSRSITLFAVSAATAMLLLDLTVVYVALPAIGRDIHVGFDELQWVVDAYALTLAAALLTAGVLADRLGRRRVFAGGLVVFTVCSALCGAASSGVLLNLARAAQGVGAAAMFASSLALLAHEFQGVERGFALGVWGGITGGRSDGAGRRRDSRRARLALDLLRQSAYRCFARVADSALRARVP